MKTLEIERITWPDVELFEREYVRLGRPVVINQGLGKCKAATWTPDYLCSVIGQKHLTVAISKDDGVFGYSTVGRSYVTERLEFSTVVNHMKVPTATKYYIMKTPVYEDLPELARDIQNPSGLQTADLEALNFWLSSADDVTPLHYDISNNFLAQIYGRKEVTLFSPDQYRFLYPFPAAASHPHVSRVNFLRPDYADFPLFEKANGINLILEAGDLLFLPAFWWHGVKSLTMSISLNFWWKLRPSQFFVPILLERLVGMYDKTRLKEFAGRDLIEIAMYALRMNNHVWTAGLLAAAVLDQHLRKILADFGVDANDIPGRLDVLNAEVSKLGNGLAIEPARISSWTSIIRIARQADDSKLVVTAVRHMVEQIKLLSLKPEFSEISTRTAVGR